MKALETRHLSKRYGRTAALLFGPAAPPTRLRLIWWHAVSQAFRSAGRREGPPRPAGLGVLAADERLRRRSSVRGQETG